MCFLVARAQARAEVPEVPYVEEMTSLRQDCFDLSGYMAGHVHRFLCFGVSMHGRNKRESECSHERGKVVSTPTPLLSMLPVVAENPRCRVISTLRAGVRG